MGPPGPRIGGAQHRRISGAREPRPGAACGGRGALLGRRGLKVAGVPSRGAHRAACRADRGARTAEFLVKLRVAGRLIEIQRVLVRHRLDDFVRATHLYRPLRFLFYLSPWTWFQRRRGATRAERLRFALEGLGPIFVKLGQALSTRRDLLPPDIADELSKLQDRVPPFPAPVARAIVEAAFGR